MRYTILDGFRGFFLLFMAVVHVNGIVDVTLGKINHHQLGWVEDAQGFVFISGFVVGLVYGGILVKRGAERMRTALRARMVLIWQYHAALVAFILVTALLVAGLGVRPNIVGPFLAEPVIFPALSLLLVSSGAFMDILPLYLWVMFATPVALLMFRNGQAVAFAALSAGAWVAAQVGLGPAIVAALERGLAELTGRTWQIGLGFNPLGWQVIYFTGLYLGFKQAEGTLDLGWLRGAQARLAAQWALGLWAALAVFDIVVTFQLAGSGFSGRVWGSILRDNMSEIYLVAFFVTLYLIGWILVAGRESGLGWALTAARWMEWLFTRPALVFLGQHSLQVFAWHVALAYLIDYAVDRDTFGELGGTILLLAATATIWIPAWIHARYVAAQKARKAAAAAPT